MGRANGMIEFAPVGPTLENGQDLGGARIYPFSTGLAIDPPAMYQNYIGSATGLPVEAPVNATPATSGMSSTGAVSVSNVMANPLDFGKSPLPWIVVGLFGAVAAMHLVHYR
jgi:hypothetical protein